MRTIAIANHKGGVAKTTTAANLGAILAQDGYTVLLIDLDPQASLTAALGINNASQTMAEVLGGASPGLLALHDAIAQLQDRLYIAPGGMGLVASDLGLVQRPGRENVLKRALASVQKNYDVCIIDCPPALSILTINGLTAADAVICPTMPQAADLRGLLSFVQSLDAVKPLNPNINLLGVLITQFDTRYNHHQEARQLLEASGLPLFNAVIGKTVRISESQGVGRALVDYDPGNPRAAEYKLFAKEVKQWLTNQQ